MSTAEFTPESYSAAFLIDFLASLGVKHAELRFSGSGDNGTVNGVTFTYQSDRTPTEESVAERWQLALARHHLLYPEYAVEAPAYAGKGEEFLAAVVEKHFDDHISPICLSR